MGPITSLADLRAALRRQAWLILLVLAIGLPAAYAFALSRPRLYEAFAVIQIETPEVAETVTGAAAIPPATANSQLDLIQQGIMARGTIEALVGRLNLFPEAETMTERVALTREAISITKIVDPAQAWRPDIQPTGLSIAVRLSDPVQAADLANAILDGLVEEASARARERAQSTLDFLLAEEARVEERIAGLEAEIADFRATHLASLPEGITSQRERLARLAEERIALDREALEFETNIARLRPDEVERQRARLAEERALLDAARDETEAAIAAAPAVERELGALTRRLGSLEAELRVITERRTEAAMAQTLEARAQTARFTVLETAQPPEFPVSADRRKIALAGGVAVGLLALGLALLREVLTPAIRNKEQMRRALGIEPVVVIPRLTSQGTRLRRQVTAAALFVAVAAGTAAVARLGIQGVQAAFDWLPRAAGAG
ncbi:chain-length determining protein [Rubellimicrobium sp. CFH 75288]|uniref:chain-length determining protein n=1 Tax=Rubellimicrobium sp. CFH 75288 TaxID=2697034 RepID=UPI0014132DD4|nr:chain-length determining protein [Rubellimicrobium sp. CFH 75288]NAZ38095.1 chain-length determining protein [Rubellimicrobium sp. CFH 75288]